MLGSCFLLEAFCLDIMNNTKNACLTIDFESLAIDLLLLQRSSWRLPPAEWVWNFFNRSIHLGCFFGDKIFSINASIEWISGPYNVDFNKLFFMSRSLKELDDLSGYLKEILVNVDLWCEDYVVLYEKLEIAYSIAFYKGRFSYSEWRDLYLELANIKFGRCISETIPFKGLDVKCNREVNTKQISLIVNQFAESHMTCLYDIILRIKESN